MFPPEFWLESYVQRDLQADADWLEYGEGTSFVYWQARLAQTTSLEVLENDDLKFRVRTRVVDDVGDEALAKELCLALNEYALGWSFAYDPEHHSVDAIAAVFAPLSPFPNDPMLRVSEAAKLSAWMSDVIAERLAETIQGTAAFGYPVHQDAVRTTYDGSYYYAECLLGRPERVVDLTDDLYPPIETIAESLIELAEADPDDLTIDRQVIDIDLTEGGRYRMSAYFAEHPLLGQCWRSYVSFNGTVAEYAVEAANAFAWSLFDSGATTLLGGWTYKGATLAFEQWTTTSELRQIERATGFHGHRASELIDRARPLSDALYAIEVDWTPFKLESVLSEDERDALGKEVIGAVADVAAPALAVDVTPRFPADRRLLWLKRRGAMAVATWFNPLGPTVSTLEVCIDPETGHDYLVYFMRHPLAPDYRVVGRLKSGSGVLAAGVDLLIQIDASLPTAMNLAGPEDVQLEVARSLYERVLQASRAGGVDLMQRATRVAENASKPWDLAPGARPHDIPAKYEPERLGLSDRDADPFPLDDSELDRGFVEWWGQVARPENFVAQFTELPDCWDAALNLQVQQGDPTFRHFDVGDYILMYSPVATVLPDLEGITEDS